MIRSVWPDNAIVEHDRNRTGRDLVIGDLHGHFDTLEHALAELAFDPRGDRLFSVGDLIDRGPRSPDALEWIEEGRIAAVRGNHEQMMVEALSRERGQLRMSGAGARWSDNGGGWWWGWSGVFADEHGMPLGPERGPDHNEHRERWLDALATIPMLRTIQTPEGNVGVVHTLGVWHRDWDEICEVLRTGAEHDLEDRKLETYWGRGPDSGLLWGRPDVEHEDRQAQDLPAAIANVDLVIIGHTPDLHARWTRKNVLCIDTGVHIHHEGYGHLTVAEVSSAEPRLHRFRRRDS